MVSAPWVWCCISDYAGNIDFYANDRNDDDYNEANHASKKMKHDVGEHVQFCTRNECINGDNHAVFGVGKYRQCLHGSYVHVPKNWVPNWNRHSPAAMVMAVGDG